jgi:hypothetical protein
MDPQTPPTARMAFAATLLRQLAFSQCPDYCKRHLPTSQQGALWLLQASPARHCANRQDIFHGSASHRACQAGCRFRWQNASRRNCLPQVRRNSFRYALTVCASPQFFGQETSLQMPDGLLAASAAPKNAWRRIHSTEPLLFSAAALISSIIAGSKNAIAKHQAF